MSESAIFSEENSHFRVGNMKESTLGIFVMLVLLVSHALSPELAERVRGVVATFLVAVGISLLVYQIYILDKEENKL